MSEQERRAHPRFPLVLAVTYPNSPSRIRDYTENLSASGLFIRTERHFEPGDRVTLLVSFPEVVDPVELACEVKRRRAASGDEPAGVAVWVPPDRQEDRRKLEQLTREAAAAVEARPGARRVLLVEDNALVAAMYTSALRRLAASEGFAGLAVEVARDGNEAFARLLAMPPVDLVVTDLYMPVMSGFSLVERIRAEDRLRTLPIVVISSGATEERERLTRLGANFLLQKPVKYQDIVSCVRSLLAAGTQPAPPARLPEPVAPGPAAPETGRDLIGSPGPAGLDTPRRKGQEEA